MFLEASIQIIGRPDIDELGRFTFKNIYKPHSRNFGLLNEAIAKECAQASAISWSAKRSYSEGMRASKRSLAEREGFEPSLPCGKHAFQACSIGHSDTSPLKGAQINGLNTLNARNPFPDLIKVLKI